MSRYAQMVERLGGEREAALGAFLMLGDPDLGGSGRMLDAIVEGGADMVEVGIPFSDPVADGPVIQAAASRALKAGIRVSDCFDLLREFRRRHPAVPVGVLTYANIAVARGVERFFADSAAAGVDSILLADVPALEAEPFAERARAEGLDWVMIAAPNTPKPTLERIARLSSGYTYCVTRFGVTGARQELALAHEALMAELESLEAPPPVFGFGISGSEQVAAAVAAGAKGVIVGSALVALTTEADGERRIVEKVRSLKSATRSLATQDR
ncbi:MAG: tryptophan synthase subunit alpha [Sphingomonas sp.]|nr:tryptophan synthase subunit alpha [Sphingomonas sp.]